jgi:hypothetical protein
MFLSLSPLLDRDRKGGNGLISLVLSKGNIMDEYLTVQELSTRIKMAPGTIRNLVWKKAFQENVHYLKPTPRKLLFIWSAVEAWLHRNASQTDTATSKSKGKCLINI